jgi:putative peptidoglycan lipid II flippase
MPLKDASVTNAKSAKQRIARGATVVVILTVGTQVTGLLSQTLIAAYFGASAVTDAYLVAIAVVSLVTLWILLPIRQILIPMFRYDLTKQGEEAAWRNVSTLMSNLLVLFAAIALVGWLAAPWLVRVVGAGFTEESSQLATSLTRVLLLSVLSVGIGTFITQIYNSYHRFFLPALTGSLSNLATAAGLLLLAPRFGIYGAAIGYVAGGFLIVAMLWPIVRQHRRFCSWRLDFRHPAMGELMQLSLPVCLTAGAMQTERIVDRVFASFLSAGSLSALAFARLLSTSLQTVLMDPFQTTAFPHFTELIAAEDFRRLSHQLFRYLRFLMFLTVPAAAGMVVLGDVIVRTVYQRGAFDETAAVLTTQALTFYALGLPAVFGSRVLARTFVCLKDTKTTMRLGVMRIAVKIALSFVLLPFFAHAAIAFAESLAFFVQLAASLVMLPAPVKAGQLRPTLRSLGSIAAVTAVMAAVVYAAKTTSDGTVPALVQLVGLIALGAATYFAASWLSRQGEAEWLGQSLRAIAQRRPAPATE